MAVHSQWLSTVSGCPWPMAVHGQWLTMGSSCPRSVAVHGQWLCVMLVIIHHRYLSTTDGYLWWTVIHSRWSSTFGCHLCLCKFMHEAVESLGSAGQLWWQVNTVARHSDGHSVSDHEKPKHRLQIVRIFPRPLQDTRQWHTRANGEPRSS